MPKSVQVGDPVLFVDALGEPHPALVTAVWGGFGSYTQEESDHNVELGGSPLPVGDSKPIPSLNVVFVSSDASKQDQYGRQTEHETSVVHQSLQAAHGMYWSNIRIP